ncbi:aspartate aminotransferase family protein [Robiginitalea biformata]|uniref:Pyridoxal-phosphate-dependent aminotransferase n=1 Tax=Robiginitalea biformata (strain ATCC BAA-864 / DSM 15991 / KCTC 12146 / HTCC2501) TaxID=313596 RepID=A4CQ34_ROBBH|nr:aminotransferase class III-fold pyridoxal phosphate-dependent enzyme [Robiginitalea biformata]EAR14119.1 Pyridoxal-phosphate-dependent aminotransferase [Robiginitalea biformata HTCC2501]
MDDDFLKYQAQTTPHPLGLNILRASGSYVYDDREKEYLDLIAGVSACTLGHCHPEVVRAIREQAGKYLHVMVYGEFAMEPAVAFCRELAAALPAPLETTYLVNSGTEAMEGAIKLARRVTGRSEILAARDAYHGNTLGSLSLMSLESRKAPFRPLLPDVRHIRFGHAGDLDKITGKTAAVVLETIQGGAGFLLPPEGYLQQVRERCSQTGTLLILDEIQPGFGRTGKLFAFEHYRCIPDILVMGKGMASGLPVGAFTASREHMTALSNRPKLGHITTFGGNPVVAAAALATLRVLREGTLMEAITRKEMLFRELLRHPRIQEIRGRGLMLALILSDPAEADHVILRGMERGLLLFWLLFEPRAVRITPPLTISEEEIRKGCQMLLELLDTCPKAPVN